MNDNVENNEFEIDIKRLFELLISRIRLIIVSVIVFGVAAFLVSNYLMTPIYKASVTMYVNSNKNATSGNISYNDITTAEKLVVAYGKMITSNAVLDEVAREVELGYTAQQIRTMISTPVDETQILTVVVSNPSPEYAQIIANAIAEIAPERITEFVEGSSMKIIDYAVMPQAPSSPNVVTNTFVGMFLGLLLSFCVIIIMELLDTRIKNEDELAKLAGVPVIGLIPEIENLEQLSE